MSIVRTPPKTGSIRVQKPRTKGEGPNYRTVTPPEGPINPIDTYNLAQTRLKGLHAN